jgi:hypothetical protein
MTSVYFEGAKVIGKPESMTDEECMSAYAMPLPQNPNIWVEHFMPSKEDIEAINAGRGIWVQLVCGPRLIPMAIFTLNENDESNDAG